MTLGTVDEDAGRPRACSSSKGLDDGRWQFRLEPHQPEYAGGPPRAPPSRMRPRQDGHAGSARASRIAAPQGVAADLPPLPAGAARGECQRPSSRPLEEEHARGRAGRPRRRFRASSRGCLNAGLDGLEQPLVEELGGVVGSRLGSNGGRSTSKTLRPRSCSESLRLATGHGETRDIRGAAARPGARSAGAQRGECVAQRDAVRQAELGVQFEQGHQHEAPARHLGCGSVSRSSGARCPPSSSTSTSIGRGPWRRRRARGPARARRPCRRSSSASGSSAVSTRTQALRSRAGRAPPRPARSRTPRRTRVRRRRGEARDHRRLQAPPGGRRRWSRG